MLEICYIAVQLGAKIPKRAAITRIFAADKRNSRFNNRIAKITITIGTNISADGRTITLIKARLNVRVRLRSRFKSLLKAKSIAIQTKQVESISVRNNVQACII